MTKFSIDKGISGFPVQEPSSVKFKRSLSSLQKALDGDFCPYTENIVGNVLLSMASGYGTSTLLQDFVSFLKNENIFVFEGTKDVIEIRYGDNVGSFRKEFLASREAAKRFTQ